MMEEIDIVDEDDKVISTSNKIQAHKNGLIHRVVHGIVINNKKEIFLVKRSPNREHGPNLFDASIGGHVKRGESYEEAINREALEELGIKGDFKFLVKYFPNHPIVKHFIAIFIIKYEGPIKLCNREFCEGIWKNINDILRINEENFTPDYYKTLLKLKNMKTFYSK